MVSEEAFRRFSAGFVQDGQSRYGCGAGVSEEDERTILRHSGGKAGFGAYLVVDALAGLGVACPVNGPASGSSLARYALEVAQEILSRAPRLSCGPPPGPVPRSPGGTREGRGETPRG